MKRFFTLMGFLCPFFLSHRQYRKMLLLFFSLFMFKPAVAQTQLVTVKLNNVKLIEAFNAIEKKTNFLFNYSDIKLDMNKIVSINASNKPVSEVLTELLRGTGVEFSFIKDHIVLKRKAQQPSRPASSSNNISGIVYDSSKQPLPGVSIKVKETAQATVTDAQGVFNIPASVGMTIMLSYIGFEPKDLVIGTSRSLIVEMTENKNSLNEVVVIGYGSQKRKDLTGSVASVNMDELNKAPVRSFDEALGGRIAGVTVSSQDGQPGSPVSIIIRGNNSLTQDNSPLYVIDGFPIEGYNNNLLSPNEIENIEVLKDASATAIYGARGANGVIIITTKKGKNGPPVVSYEAYYGIQQSTRQIPVLNAYQFVQLQLEQLGAAAFAPLYLTPSNRTIEDYQNVPTINWQDQLTRRAPMYNQFVSVNGGTDQTKYSISGSVNGQDGIVVASSYKRYQGRVVIDQNINKFLKAGINANYSSVLQKGTPPSAAYSSATSNLMYQAWGYRPVTGNDADLVNQLYDPAIDPTNNYIVSPYSTALNELRNNTTNSIVANAYLEYQITNNLKFRTTGGINNSTARADVFNNSMTNSGGPRSVFGAGVNGSVTYSELNNWLNENTLAYSKIFNRKHDLSILAGFTEQGNQSKSYGLSANHLPNESLGLSGLDEGTPQPVQSTSSQWTLASFLSRVNYAYNSKYLFTVTYRADGSSKFAANNKWSYFPSAAFAWRLINESFMKKLPVISNAKVRLSYGITGNNRVGDFSYLSTLTSTVDAIYPFNNNPAGNLGAYRNAIGNPDLKWETTEQFDAGLDLGFFRDRIALTVDAYQKTTKDLLLNAQLPGSLGFTSAFKNIGKVRNQGIEITLNTVNIAGKDFNWNSNFNIAFNFSKVLQLTQNQDALLSSVRFDQNYNTLTPYIAKLGQPVSSIYGLVYDGLYQYSDFNILLNGKYVLKDNIAGNGNTRSAIQPGDIKYKDLNGDNTIDARDYTIIGRALPLHTGGLNNNFNYKGFDLNIFLQWSYGNDVINANRYIFESGYRLSLNQFASYANRWTPTNQNTDIPRYSTPGNYQYSSKVVEDGSYIRLKTVSLGYNFSKNLLAKVHVKGLRLAVSGQNLYTITGYEGLDPEVSVRNTTLTQGFDFSPYPRARTFTVNLNVKF